MNINNDSSLSFQHVGIYAKDCTEAQKKLADKITNAIDYSNVVKELETSWTNSDVILSKGKNGGIVARFMHNNDSFIKDDNGKELTMEIENSSDENINKLLEMIDTITKGKFKMPKFDEKKYRSGENDFFSMFKDFYNDCNTYAEKNLKTSDMKDVLFDSYMETYHESVWSKL